MKNRWYNGKELCQGCKQPGFDKPRDSKDDLCRHCKESLAKGMAISGKIEGYCFFFQHYHAYHKDISFLLHDILACLHNEHVHDHESRDSMKSAWGSNGKFYTIPCALYGPIKNKFDALDALCRELDTIPEKTKAAANAERTKIYNEGVEMGRNLLMQLESGGLTMDDFAKNIPYHKY